MLSVMKMKDFLASVPNTGRDLPMPPRPEASKPPTMDALCSAIDTAMANLQTLEYRRAEALREFDEVRAQFADRIRTINDCDEQTQEALISLQRELRARLEQRGFLVPVGEHGELSAVVPISKPPPAAELLPDLDNIEPKQVKP